MSQGADSTPPTSAGARHTSIPIARNSAPAYERPERARTSHACEPCRERKTKCDGERPSCRRCLNTGTSCHYGYGKGWRKRKTQEDLSSTSQRLARYETLLSEILPLVNPSVQEMIEEARKEELGGSDSPESEVSSQPGSLDRPLLQLPVPFAGQNSRLPGLGQVFESHQPNNQSGSSLRQIPRLSSDEGTLGRLPSITATGMLIDRERREGSAHLSPDPLSGLKPPLLPAKPQEMADAIRKEQSAPT